MDSANDTIYLVGDYLGEGGAKYEGTVKAKDGCLYGIPRCNKQIVKFDPTKHNTTSIVGGEAEENFLCWGNGALGPDGNIYAVTESGQILRIDLTNNSHSIIAEAPQSIQYGWYSTVKGGDGIMYFPPHNASCVMMLNLETKKRFLVGDGLGDRDWKD